MNPSVRQAWLFKHQEFLLFIGLWLWLVIFYTLDKIGGSWSDFLWGFAVLSLIELPVLAFVWNKNRIQISLGKKRYIWLWSLCFCVVLPALTAMLTMFITGSIQQFIALAALLCFVLELSLILNNYYLKRVQHAGWIKKLSFDHAILLTAVLISLTLSIMAVSSLDKPEYYNNGYRLIGFEFNPVKIIKYFGRFLGYLIQFLIMYLVGYLFFFINSKWLISKVFKEKGLLIYIFSVFATVAFLYPLLGQLLAILPLNDTFGFIFSSNPFKLENAGAALAIMFLSLPIILALQWARQNTQIISLEQEKTRTELDLLKQQLNPHFFFNTLNNLYALSLQQSEQTSESILQLSELMRYVIYKGQESSVSVKEEVKYLEDYIQLQKIRLREPLSLGFEREIEDEELNIAPLLLIVLIENAFKHGIEPAEHSARLKLHLICSKKRLYFSCENSVEVGINEKGGIGLVNLKKRLDLLYPNRYTFKKNAENNMFKAELEINLS